MYTAVSLHRLASSNNFTLWHYKSKDASKEILENGYFNVCEDLIKRGDIIICDQGFAPLVIFVSRDRVKGGDILTQKLLQQPRIKIEETHE